MGVTYELCETLPFQLSVLSEATIPSIIQATDRRNVFNIQVDMGCSSTELRRRASVMLKSSQRQRCVH
ncbi:hypothetical protein KIN20_031460 [Parelaphostrongylus tenuis]|uniref:Uncharacterized protein n=1 Tax=Parelaphostrongylus tenuis TaxID=148309 RepID=A0AAD5WH88_PARTN|nr:hypothetical protein KIN20_031460 [Parelaphostrongylus tenuis]